MTGSRGQRIWPWGFLYKSRAESLLWAVIVCRLYIIQLTHRFYFLISYLAQSWPTWHQVCQLPDVSQRSQTFCCTADFSTTFLYMLKTKTFLHIPTKPPASNLKFKNFDSICQKNFVTRQKREKRSRSAGSSNVWAGLWPAATRTLSTSPSFKHFWNTMLATLPGT